MMLVSTALLALLALICPTHGAKNNNTVGIAPLVSYGNSASLGMFPWVVSLNSYDSVTTKYTFLCAGSLIHPMWVLTSAFCADKLSAVKVKVVRAGSMSPDTGGVVLSFMTANVFKNPGYVTATKVHNLALIKLDKEAPINGDNIQHIPIMKTKECCANYDGLIFLVKGWGHIDTSAALQSNLRYTSAVQIPNLQCVPVPYSMLQMNPGAVCTLKGSPCSLDEGGPMDLQADPKDWKTAQLYAVVSDPQPPTKCNSQGPAARHMKVCMYHDWLFFITKINFNL